MKPEEQLQKDVIGTAHLLKWRVAHFRTVRIQRRDGSVHYATPVQADGAGWPDLVLVRDRVIYAELKSDRGTLSTAQQDWLHALGNAGAECHVWNPRDWKSGHIEAILRKHAIGAA
jgi:hypothetical protein